VDEPLYQTSASLFDPPGTLMVTNTTYQASQTRARYAGRTSG
jgi:hypothetical protein